MPAMPPPTTITAPTGGVDSAGFPLLGVVRGVTIDAPLATLRSSASGGESVRDTVYPMIRWQGTQPCALPDQVLSATSAIAVLLFRFGFSEQGTGRVTVLLQGIGPQLADAIGHHLSGDGKSVSLAAGHEEHIQALPTNADLVEQLAGALHAGSTALVAAHMVAVANWAGDQIDAISALLERFKQVADIGLARTRHPDELHIGGVLNLQRPGGIRRHITAVYAVEGGDLRLEGVHRCRHGGAFSKGGSHAPRPPMDRSIICSSV